jgi:HAD superfamily phosphoserine phosphatase-like hydrolase
MNKLAFFDVDGTIYKGRSSYTANDFMEYVEKNEIWGKKPLTELREMRRKYETGELDYHKASHGIIRLLGRTVEGQKEQEVGEVVNCMLREIGEDVFSEWVLPTCKVLQKEGYQIVLISGGVDFLVEKIAKLIGKEVKYYATEFQKEAGVYVSEFPKILSSEMKGEIVSGYLSANENKAEIRSIAVGDSKGDIPMLELVDQAYIYSQSEHEGIFETAKERGWTVFTKHIELEETKQIC